MDRPRPGDRPSTGDLGGFLGIDRPIRPDGNFGNRFPNRSGSDRPRPGGRPGIDNRPGFVNRPNFGDRWSNNNVISNRPTWANIDRSTNVNIHNRWNNAFVRPSRPGWGNRPADRMNHWNSWGNRVRNNWGNYHRHNNWFSGNWWQNHHGSIGGWHYHNWSHSRPWGYWWTVPAWGSLTNWFAWSAPVTVWSEPVYYDYGAGGNVIYEDNYVYVGGEPVATAEQFAQSAMDLATVEPPETETIATEIEWMPLGTFAVSTNEKDTLPSMTVQLAVNKLGIVSGTLYNSETDQTQAIQGQVDKNTQRVAMRIGESEDIVAETGLYNLTQNEAPVLVHFGTDRVENYLLIRLTQPEEEGAPP